MLAPKVAPPFVDLLNRISLAPEVPSGHTTYTLFTLFPDAATAGEPDGPALLLRSMVGSKEIVFLI
jgi:hypothetical protein